MKPSSTVAAAPARRRIGRNFFWKSAAEGSKALQALYFILLARHLGTAELGRFSVGFSAAMILATVGDFGLNTLLTRQVAVDRSQGTSVFLQTAYLKVLFFAALFAGVALWPGLGERRTFYLLFLGVAAGRNMVDQLSYLCLAYEKLIIEAKMKFFLGFFSLGLAWLTLSIAPSVEAAAAALLGSAEDLMPQAPVSAKTVVVEKPQVLKKREAVVSLSPASIAESPSKKPMLSDIRYEKRLMGPLDELSGMRLQDFRRLSHDPEEAAKKLLAKIELLAAESYEKRTEGVAAWRSSPLMALYLAITREALDVGIPLQEVLEARQKESPEMLSLAECQAIRSLNGELQA
jgi:hypothetical protein